MGSASAETKELIATMKGDIPAMGEPFELMLPQVLVNQIHTLVSLMQDHLERIAPDNTREQFDKYAKARNDIEVEVETMKAFYRSQRDKKAEMEGKTKADVLKEIWEAAGEMSDKPLPPLDEEMLADLAEEPAIIEG